jgi:hypothetical protein
MACPGRSPPPQKKKKQDLVPVLQKAGLASRPVWMGSENLAPTKVLAPAHSAHSQSLYRPRNTGRSH